MRALAKRALAKRTRRLWVPLGKMQPKVPRRLKKAWKRAIEEDIRLMFPVYCYRLRWNSRNGWTVTVRTPGRRRG